MGGGGTSGRRGGSVTLRTSAFEWYEAKVGPQRTVTPGEGEVVRELTPLEHVKACLRMDEAQARGDARPTLAYFHWPHEHPVHGRTTEDVCKKVLDDEHAARWGLLYRCVQVDMGASDERLIELLGRVDKPGLFVLDAQAQVVSRIPAVNTPAKLQKALKDAYARFPELQHRLDKELADQDKLLAQAKKLAKDDDLDGALALLSKIRTSKVRVGAAYDEALRAGYDLEQRREREKAAERR